MFELINTLDILVDRTTRNFKMTFIVIATFVRHLSMTDPDFKNMSKICTKTMKSSYVKYARSISQPNWLSFDTEKSVKRIAELWLVINVTLKPCQSVDYDRI